MQDYKNMTIDKIKEIGRNTGASLLDVNRSELPCIGRDEIDDANDWHEAIQDQFHDSEEGMRQFSPFEFFAHDLNMRDDRDEAWEAYEGGLHEALEEYLSQAYPLIDEEEAERRFCELLDETHDPILIGVLEFTASQVLCNTDPVAYRQGVLEYVDAEKLDIA